MAAAASCYTRALGAEEHIDADEQMTGDEMLIIMAQHLDNPDGMGASGMDDYDKKYAQLFVTNGNDHSEGVSGTAIS
jgi:hypothetical protein